MAAGIHRSWRSFTALFIALGIAALFRVYAIVRFGPVIQPDSADYLDFAKNIVSGSSWFHSASVESVTAFRMIGYPAFIAAVQLIAGASFGLILVILQSILSLVAMIYLYRTGRRLGLPDWLAACVILAYGCGVIAVFDINILTDSPFANLAVIVICLLSLAVVERKPPHAAAVLGSGALFAGCVLIRDATLFASPFFALGAAAWGYEAGRSWKDGLRVAILFLLPAFIVWQAYTAWNQYRTGYRFMTTGGQHAFLMMPVMLEERGIVVLRDPRLREAYVATASFMDDEFFTRVREMGVRINRDAGLDAIARTTLAMQAYVTAWCVAPIAMLKLAAQEYRANQFLLLINFNFALRELKGLSGFGGNIGYRAYFRNLLAAPSGPKSILLFTELIGLVTSGVIFIGFVSGGLYRLWRIVWCRDAAPLDLVALWYLVLYAGFVAMYAMIHLELRYTICVQAVALVGGAMTAQYALHFIKGYSK